MGQMHPIAIFLQSVHQPVPVVSRLHYHPESSCLNGCKAARM
jgi:hypothetical protein